MLSSSKSFLRARAAALRPTMFDSIAGLSLPDVSSGTLRLLRWWYTQRFRDETAGAAGRAASIRQRASDDLIAGIVVATLIIPSSMAYSMLAGLPPHVGLYASVLPLLVYAILGRSTCLSVGPVTVVSLLTASSLAPFAEAGSAAYLAHAVALATLSGVFLIAMGLLRLGFLASLLSHPVLLGFTTGIGLVIVVNQLKHVLGVKVLGSDFLPLFVMRLLATLPEVNIATLCLGAVAILALTFKGQLTALIDRRGLLPPVHSAMLNRGMPLAVVALGTAVAWMLGLTTVAGVAVVGAIPSGMVPLTSPLPGNVDWLALVPAAILLSLIGFMEGFSIAKRLERADGQPLSTDKELIAVGAANIAAACSGGYPVSGGTARTVLNHNSGASTPLANAWAALIVLGCLLLLAPLIYHLPQAVLAAIVITAAASLITFKPMADMMKNAPVDAAVAAVACAATVTLGAKWGLGAGLLASLAALAWRALQIEVVETSSTGETVSLQLTGWLNFANAAIVETAIFANAGARSGISCCHVSLDARHGSDISGRHMLDGLARRLKARGVTMVTSPAQ